MRTIEDVMCRPWLYSGYAWRAIDRNRRCYYYKQKPTKGPGLWRAKFPSFVHAISETKSLPSGLADDLWVISLQSYDDYKILISE